MTPATAHAHLELRLGTDSPEGILTDALGHAHPFRGWVELAGAVEEWRERCATAPPALGGATNPTVEETPEMTTTSTTGTTSTPTVTPKDRHRAIWAAGDYAQVAERLVMPIGGRLVSRLAVGAGEDVLDVATGTGSAAIPAAAAGATVTGLDLVPDLLDVARRRAREAGAEVEWIAGDAEDLPFPDRSFDVVMSAIGIQFAPDHRRSAHEIARVCRPGGRIGLCNWTPEGYIGRFFATLRPYMPAPPAGASPPPLWGSATHVEDLFAGTGVTLAYERDTVAFEHDSPEAFIDFMATFYGPLVMARAALTPDGRWDDLRSDLIELSASMDSGTRSGFHVDSEYLVVVGTRAR
jgi:SAM-dependent methyltransferase